MALTIRPHQIPAGDLPRRTWDAAVVGAGPAGAATALRLAAGGYHVVLLDRDAFPREKPCGDGLLPDALAALDRLGAGAEVRDRARRWDTLRVWSPRRLDAGIAGEFLTLPRSHLDALVAARATAAGAVFCRGEVVAVVGENPTTARLRLRGEPDLLAARLVLWATGARLGRLRGTGLPARPDPGRASAVRCYVRAPCGPEELVVSYDRSVLPGYGWIFPLGDGLFNVGCGLFASGRGTSLPRAFGRFLGAFPPARALLAEGRFASPLRGAPLRCGLRGILAARPAARVLAVGESVGTTLPFTGEGVGPALESAELAAEAAAATLACGDLSTLDVYPRRVEETFGLRHRRHARAQAWLARPVLCDFLAWRARRSPGLRAGVSRVLAGENDPSEMLSTAALVRSLFR